MSEPQKLLQSVHSVPGSAGMSACPLPCFLLNWGQEVSWPVCASVDNNHPKLKATHPYVVRQNQA